MVIGVDRENEKRGRMTWRKQGIEEAKRSGG
jgi:hypothetical protein